MTPLDATIEARINHHGERMTDLADERPLRAALHCVTCVVWATVGYASGFWHRAAARERARQDAVRVVVDWYGHVQARRPERESN